MTSGKELAHYSNREAQEWRGKLRKPIQGTAVIVKGDSYITAYGQESRPPPRALLSSKSEKTEQAPNLPCQHCPCWRLLLCLFSWKMVGRLLISCKAISSPAVFFFLIGSLTALYTYNSTVSSSLNN